MMWMSDSRAPSESAFATVELPGAADSLAFGPGFALPAFASFFLRCSFSISWGVVELKKAMRLLSGDQTGSAVPFGRSVMMRASPPASDRIAICAGRGLPLSSFSPPRVHVVLAIGHAEGIFVTGGGDHPDRSLVPRALLVRDDTGKGGARPIGR